jgi:hypothetical protein
MPAKKIAVVFGVILVAIGGFVAGLYLLNEQQDLREEAAVPGGQAQVSVSPNTGNFEIGDTVTTQVDFNTGGIASSGVAIRLSYPFTGASPEVSVSSIEVNQELLATGDWTCPTQRATQQGGNVLIDIGCANTSAQGFTSTSNVKLATIQMRVNRTPNSNPVVLRFDPSLSVITRRSDNNDILLIPQSQGSYTIALGGAEATPTTAQSTGTPTPTTRVTSTPTTTKTPTPTKTVTSTGTITATKTPTPTSEEEETVSSSTATPTTASLPEAGVSYPTILGILFGVIIIVGAIALAL